MYMKMGKHFWLDGFHYSIKIFRIIRSHLLLVTRLLDLIKREKKFLDNW